MNIKVGDTVINKHNGGWQLGTVTEITKAGNIRIDVGHTTKLYNSDGTLRGGSKWFIDRIYKPTEEELRKKKFIIHIGIGCSTNTDLLDKLFAKCKIASLKELAEIDSLFLEVYHLLNDYYEKLGKEE